MIQSPCSELTITFSMEIEKNIEILLVTMMWSPSSSWFHHPLTRVVKALTKITTAHYYSWATPL